MSSHRETGPGRGLDVVEDFEEMVALKPHKLTDSQPEKRMPTWPQTTTQPQTNKHTRKQTTQK